MPPTQQQGQKEFVDTLSVFDAGVNSYLPTLLLPKNQLSSALNTTVRGDYVTQRSILRKITLDPHSQSILNDAIAQGQYQAGTYFKPDFGPEGMANIIGGELISIFPDANANTASAIKISSWTAAAWVNGNNYAVGDFASFIVNGVVRDFRSINAMTPSTIAPPQDPGNWAPQNLPSGQNWVWQSEMFVIWNDGVSNPVFYNVNTSVATRSTNGVPIPSVTTTATATFVVPAVGATVQVQVTHATTGPNSIMQVGDNLYFTNFGNMTVGLVTDDTHVTLINVNIRPGLVIPIGAGIHWSEVSSNELPPGRIGVNGKGRNWIQAVTGNQFFATDIAGGSSGTLANQFRDAPLNITENNFLAGGGNFLVPGPGGNITAMRFVATLDQSLGQGPLQVFTKTLGFSCQTPVDRLTWQDVTNPILTESIKGYGATGQDTTINVNSDLLFRSPIGFSSQILARRDFDTWGNVPISIEVSQITDSDNQTLLNWGSAIDFDNRVLWTVKPTLIAQGVIHKGLIPLNLDPVSSLRGKQPSVYDALQWTGLNVFKLFTGSFANRERAFAVCWNVTTSDVELYEIVPTADTSYLDNDIVRITWAFNTASLFRESSHVFKQLIDGEIYVDDLRGQVDFQVWYKPDQYPCFQPWTAWTECQTQPRKGTVPGFRPRMGLGSPYSVKCDPTTNRRLDLGYTFDFRFVITGAVRFLGGTFKSIRATEPEFAQPNCVNFALLQAMQAIGGGSGPPIPPPGPFNVTVVDDAGGIIIIDSSGNVLLG